MVYVGFIERTASSRNGFSVKKKIKASFRECTWHMAAYGPAAIAVPIFSPFALSRTLSGFWELVEVAYSLHVRCALTSILAESCRGLRTFGLFSS